MTLKHSLQTVLIFSAVLWQACSSKEVETREAGIAFSEALAREISFVTNGDVHFDEVIQVTFNTDVVGESELEKPTEEDVFDFEPGLEGKAVWVKTNVLQFMPEEGLPLRTRFNGTLHLQKLSARFKEEKLEDLRFYLNVLGRDIAGFDGKVDLKDRNDPRHLLYKGTIFFTEKTDIKKLSKAASLQGAKALALSWSKIDDRTFQFTSEEIKRNDKEASYHFTIEEEELGLASAFSEQFVVAPLKEMKPTAFVAEEEGKSPRIRIRFSDDVDMEQQLDGLLSVEPTVRFEAKKLGNAIILDGAFKFGEAYEVTVKKGLRSRWATKTATAFSEKIHFSNISPQLEFASDGIILPGSNQKRIQFYTTNVKRVHLEVKKLFNEQIGQFLRAEQLTSTKNRNKGFSDAYASTVGVIIKNQTIDLGNNLNEWVLNEFDLSELFTNYQDGIYLVRINFTPEDVSIPVEGDKLSYIQEKGQVYKPVFLSNLGLTVKHTDKATRVFVTDIISAEPLANVRVSLLNYSGEEMASVNTDADGLATFTSKRYFYHVVARKDKQISALKKDNMRWSNSGFAIEGARDAEGDTRGFIYTERGVYRPGDPVNVSFIARNSDKSFPQDHPASITVKDPEYKTIFEQTIVKSTDGFYAFAFETEENAPTGNYSITINAGGSYFHHQLKVETVVAEKLKIEVKPQKRVIVWTDGAIDYGVHASYLFGAPAALLKAEVDVEIIPAEKKFPGYGEYTFTRADVSYKSFTKNILKATLDAEGKLLERWVMPPLGEVPSMLKAKLNAKVWEKGGMPNEGWNVVDIEPYPSYVGIQDPSGYGYFKTGETVKFPVVLLNSQGEKVSGEKLHYKVYRNDKSWWYQYDNRRNYQLKYKEDNKTYLETEGSITAQNGTAAISFNPSENGEYLIEVSQGSNGHIASLFFSAYRYGSVAGGDLNEGNLALKSDKAVYRPGETAQVKLPNPQQGKLLLTIEKDRKIIHWEWVDPGESSGDEMLLEIPVTEKMLPNAYVTVSVIQPHAQTVNDRPIRTFGILPLMVVDPDTKIEFAIEAGKELLPNEPFELEIHTLNQKPAQFTVAVVDEGLLSLTQFHTPKPWNEFFRKVGLFVETYDVFSHVMSTNKGDVFQTFSIGGDEALSYRESQADPINGQKRFKPVSMFKGPVMTDSKGRAVVKFTMPNYTGAVRVMVVGAAENSYGSAETSIPVRSDIIMQPTIPRVLNPGDEFILPVSLFKTNPAVKEARFDLFVEGPLEIVGTPQARVDFSQTEEADIHFKVRVKQAVGQGKISLSGVADNIVVSSETAVKVVPTSPRLYDKSTEKIAKGSSLRMQVPAVGLQGTNQATLDINIFPNMDFDHRLEWLIQYPYGCIEQTTSAVFPQLTLKKMGYFRQEELAEIDKNINAAIQRLQQFVLRNGAFSYWPGSGEASPWGTNFAVHFLVEAKNAGYAVPDYLLTNATAYLNGQARQNNGKLTTRVNRAFILALANKAPVGEMNLLMENELSKMSNAEKWMLAAAYHAAGVDNIKTNILTGAQTSTKAYEPFSDNFGSRYRDDALILYCATLMDDKETAELLAKSVASNLSGKEYLSTQSAGYMLLALGNYFEKRGISAADGQLISGKITLANGKSIDFEEKGRFTLPLKETIGEEIQVALSGASGVDQVYATVSYNGVPLKDESQDMSKNLALEVRWYNPAGEEINPQNRKQGDVVYGRFSVSNTSPIQAISELALVQIFPSGWQIENLRLNNELLPEWTDGWQLHKEDYLDLRDDRAMWFFDVKGNEPLDFIVKLNCVTPGEFWLPGTLVEAMYSSDFKATKAGKKVVVEPFKVTQ